MPDRLAALPRALMALGFRRHVLVLCGSLAILALGVLFGTRLKLETDVMSLLPRNDPAVHLFRQVLEEFGTLDTLVVAIPVGGEERLELALATADALGKELAASPHITRVSVQLDDPVKLAETALRHAVLFLDEGGLAELEHLLAPAGLAARAADIRAAIEAPHGILGKELALRDPLGFLPMLLGQVSRAPASLKVDYSSGYYLSADHSLVVVLAKPRGAAQDVSFDEALFADLDLRIAAARQRVAEQHEVAAGEVPEVWLGGGHRIAIEDAHLIRSDIITNSVTSVLGVMLLFFLAYRRIAAAQYAFLPLAVGMALTFLFTALAVGKLNSATAGFAALLVGLGIDFTIVLYGRYLEARGAGLPLREATDDVARTTGPAVLMAAMTTVGTFYALILTHFSGLREFGLLTGTGIMLMAFAAFVLLPALVRLFDTGREPPPPSRWLQLAPPMHAVLRHRRAVIIAFAVGSLAAAAMLPGLRFDDDMRNLRSPSNQGVRVHEKVAAAFGASFNAMMIRVEGPDEATTLARVRTLAVGLDSLVERGVLSSYESLANLTPPQPAQARALAWVAAHHDLTDPQRVKGALAAELTRAGLVASAFAPGLQILDQTLRPNGPATLEIWRGTPLEEVIQRSLRVEPGRAVTVVNVYPPPGQWRREAPPDLEALVASVPGTALTGVNVISQRLRQTVRSDAFVAVTLGLVFVVALLLLRLRKFGHALLCLLPVAIAVLWTLGLMAALGMTLNLLNVFMVLMIIGIGSDYGIYMLHRMRESHTVEALAETGRSVLLAALTTIVGFGTLVTTHYPGLQSMGWMTVMGVAFSCLSAIFLLPLVTGKR
jgi:predicted RND superfamily exporter protein